MTDRWPPPARRRPIYATGSTHQNPAWDIKRFMSCVPVSESPGAKYT